MSALVMAFDYGMKKIGIAVGQHVTKTATPIAIIRASNGVPDWTRVEQLVGEWQPELFIVGLPLNMDGSESEMARRAARFARKLNGRFGIRVDTMDERLTTFEARQRSKQDGEVDDRAAAEILESWFRSSD
ncbi:MAG: Holliday junction resolvase RuvX [Proteobacteria bacterium]|jgi:putative holliday junction resolvase|nr:Holliday junction resolvase RuvX [Pseudomonadota bacterium]MDA1300745.1 Holliday junction resolvase RuvX [Pseudomonadota bacterium]